MEFERARRDRWSCEMKLLFASLKVGTDLRAGRLFGTDVSRILYGTRFAVWAPRPIDRRRQEFQRIGCTHPPAGRQL